MTFPSSLVLLALLTGLLTSPGPGVEGLDACRVRAQVVDGDGRVVADARLGALSLTSGGGGQDAGWLAEADGEGRVALRLPRDVYRYAVASASHPTTPERTLDLAASCTAAALGRIVLESGRVLAGRVVDGDGEPLAGASAEIGWDPRWPRYLVATEGALVRPHRQVTTDAGGRFVVPGLVPGTE
jgi:hypothetical protein